MMKNQILQDTQPIDLRDPNRVMRLERMGSFHQSRLSFMRVLLRNLKTENWTFDRPVWRFDEKGVGVATYRAKGPTNTYTLVAFGHDLPDEKRSDRVIADAWDATFTLVDGEPGEDDLKRLSKNVPYQEAGRVSEKELVLSRANRSVRLFAYVVDCLAKGEQPEVSEITKVGYLMRTTAVYGSGKFGAADRDDWANRPEFLGSFQPELLSVWFIRAFTIDIVEHLAKIRSPQMAIPMAADIKRQLGVGNSTGLGMAPFLINHPSLIHAWINARETALSRVRSLPSATREKADAFREFVTRAEINAKYWYSDHPLQKEKIASLLSDFTKLQTYLSTTPLSGDYPWNALYEWANRELGTEGQEQLISLMLEPYGGLIDDLAKTMLADEASAFRINGQMKIHKLKSIMDTVYKWAKEIDYSSKDAIARVWYVSEEKLEPRLGERFEEPIEPYEQPLAPGRDAVAAMHDLNNHDDDASVAEFLLKHPQHRHIIRRAQIVSGLSYAEVRDNTISSRMLPIDLLRCKLSFFGATRFDPRSDRWVRITMFQNAPYPDELQALDPDDLAYPPLSNAEFVT